MLPIDEQRLLDLIVVNLGRVVRGQRVQISGMTVGDDLLAAGLGEAELGIETGSQLHF